MNWCKECSGLINIYGNYCSQLCEEMADGKEITLTLTKAEWYVILGRAEILATGEKNDPVNKLGNLLKRH